MIGLDTNVLLRRVRLSDRRRNMVPWTPSNLKLTKRNSRRDLLASGGGCVASWCCCSGSSSPCSRCLRSDRRPSASSGCVRHRSTWCKSASTRPRWVGHVLPRRTHTVIRRDDAGRGVNRFPLGPPLRRRRDEADVRSPAERAVPVPQAADRDVVIRCRLVRRRHAPRELRRGRRDRGRVGRGTGNRQPAQRSLASMANRPGPRGGATTLRIAAVPENAKPDDLAAAFPPDAPPRHVSLVQMEGLLAAVYGTGAYTAAEGHSPVARGLVLDRVRAVLPTLNDLAAGRLTVSRPADGNATGNHLGLAAVLPGDPTLVKLQLRAAWAAAAANPAAYDATALRLLETTGEVDTALHAASQLWHLPAGSGRMINDPADKGGRPLARRDRLALPPRSGGGTVYGHRTVRRVVGNRPARAGTRLVAADRSLRT